MSSGQSAQGYYITRIRNSDGATAPACGTSPSSLTPITNCDDQAVPEGTYRYQVTAVHRSWTAVSGLSNTVIADTTTPTVTIDQAAGQNDPTRASPINFTVVFSETVTGFTNADITLGGTAGATQAIVTGSGTTYSVAVSGMTGDGTVRPTIPAGGASDTGGNPNTASTSTDNTVTYDTTAPTVTINQAASQTDPTNSSPINFTVVFSEPVTGFTATDIAFTGTAGATTATITGSGPTYNVAISGIGGNGTVRPTIAAGSAADVAGSPNTASTSTDNTVTYDTTAPTVTINQAASQTDPTNSSPINFTVVFSEPVTGFTATDIAFTGTAGATTATVAGSGAAYTIAVSGMTGNGTVRPTIAAGSAADVAGNPNTASTSTDNTVTYTDTTAPTVTINQAAGQADPTNASTVNFTVVFSEPVTGFTAIDIVFTGTAGATTAVVTGSGSTYNVAVSGMALNGTIRPTILIGAALDAAGNLSTASTSTDNTVTYDTTKPTAAINQASGQADPTNVSPISFTVVFSEPVTGFTGTDITFIGTAGATTANVTGSGTTYNVTVSGMTANGTVRPTIAAGNAADSAGNTNTASTSTDNTVTYDNTAPGAPTSLAYADGTAAAGDKVTGRAEVNSTIVATQTQGPNVGTTYTTTANTTGSFTIAVDNITTGTVTYSVTAKDAAGNVSVASVLGPVTDTK